MVENHSFLLFHLPLVFLHPWWMHLNLIDFQVHIFPKYKLCTSIINQQSCWWYPSILTMSSGLGFGCLATSIAIAPVFISLGNFRVYDRIEWECHSGEYLLSWGCSESLSVFNCPYNIKYKRRHWNSRLALVQSIHFENWKGPISEWIQLDLNPWPWALN